MVAGANSILTCKLCSAAIWRIFRPINPFTFQ